MMDLQVLIRETDMIERSVVQVLGRPNSGILQQVVKKRMPIVENEPTSF